MLVGYFNRKVDCSCCNSSDHSGGCGWIPPSLNFSPVVFVHFDLRGAVHLIHHPCIAMWGVLTSSITGNYAPSQKRTTTTHHTEGEERVNGIRLCCRSVAGGGVGGPRLPFPTSQCIKLLFYHSCYSSLRPCVAGGGVFDGTAPA